MRVIEIENNIFSAWTAQDRQEYLRLTQKYLVDLKKRVAKLQKIKDADNKKQGG